MINYVIYQLNCGRAIYVGSSRRFLKQRLPKHLKDLKLNRHVNDALQREFNKGHKVTYKILHSGKTLFPSEVLRTEQRYINKYGTVNEAVASKQTKYSRKEFLMDLTDLIVKNWKIISVIIFIVCLIGFNMTPEQAQQFITMLVEIWSNNQ